MSQNNAHVLNSIELGLLAMPSEIDWVINETKILTRPAGKTVLVLQAFAGDWQLKPGSYDGNSPNPAFPSTPSVSTTGGAGYWPLKDGRDIAIAAPNKMTVKGTGSLAFYWV